MGPSRTGKIGVGTNMFGSSERSESREGFDTVLPDAPLLTERRARLVREIVERDTDP